MLCTMLLVCESRGRKLRILWSGPQDPISHLAEEKSNSSAATRSGDKKLGLAGQTEDTHTPLMYVSICCNLIQPSMISYAFPQMFL